LNYFMVIELFYGHWVILWWLNLLLWSLNYFMVIELWCIASVLGTTTTRSNRVKMADQSSGSNVLNNNLNVACRWAAEAIQAIQNITKSDVRQLATATSTTSNHLTPNTLLQRDGNPIKTELASRFPTFRSSYNPRISGKRSAFGVKGPTSKRGRPSASTIVHKDLIIIPDPNMDQVPTHKKRIHLEEKGLVVHEFPFHRNWDAFQLKLEIRKQLPKDDIMFEFVKVFSFTLCIYLEIISR